MMIDLGVTDTQLLTFAIVMIYVHYNRWVKIERKAQYMRWLFDRPEELAGYEELKKFEDLCGGGNAGGG